MSVLRKSHPVNNVWTQNGFEYEKTNANGSLNDCYEVFVGLSSTYDAFVAINPKTKEYVIYIEYECGGEVSTVSGTLYSDNENEMFEELNKEVEFYTKYYRDFCEENSDDRTTIDR